LPTAWIHFFFVESFPIYTAVLSWHHIMNQINTRCELLFHHIDTSLIERYFSDLFFLGFAHRVELDFSGVGSDGSLKLPDRTVEGVDVPWLIIAWILPTGAGLLYLFVWLAFANECIWDFQSGAYLHFTWALPKKRPYQVLLVVMASAPVFLVAVWVFQLCAYADKFVYDVNARVLYSCLLPFVFFVVSLMTLAFPHSPTHAWDSDDMDELMFRRSWIAMFFQRNEKFGMKLMDALWTAQNGDLSRLGRYLFNPAAAEAVLEICQRAQQAEAEQGGKGSNVELQEVLVDRTRTARMRNLPTTS